MLMLIENYNNVFIVDLCYLFEFAMMMKNYRFVSGKIRIVDLYLFEIPFHALLT